MYIYMYIYIYMLYNVLIDLASSFATDSSKAGPARAAVGAVHAAGN